MFERRNAILVKSILTKCLFILSCFKHAKNLSVFGVAKRHAEPPPGEGVCVEKTWQRGSESGLKRGA